MILSGMLRELKRLYASKMDLFMVTIAPLALIILFGSMFLASSAHHLPIAVVDRDQTLLSQKIIQDLSLNETLDVTLVTTQRNEAELQLNKNEIWGYVIIPPQAEQRLVKAQDAQIAVIYNQSYFSIGSAISSAMTSTITTAILSYLTENHYQQLIPKLNGHALPSIKISTLFNPDMSYEFYLEPLLLPAMLHLMLCCCVAFSIGREFLENSVSDWSQGSPWQALLAKNLVFIFIFMFWTALWMFWLTQIRGWFIAGSVWFLLLGQFCFYFAYALISSFFVIGTKSSEKTFDLLAVYGGSSLSFAGVTLPITINTPLFTQIWASIIPYTSYMKLQIQQWDIGSPLSVSFLQLKILLIFCILFFVLSGLMLKKYLNKENLT